MRSCPHSVAQVAASDEADFVNACTGAQDALTFFLDLGIQPTIPIALEVVPKLPKEAGSTAAGAYFEKQGRIRMLSYAELRKAETWFNLPIDRELYRSLAAHEVAHAMTGCSFGIQHPTIQAKEYLAYVAMFSTMKPAFRERVLKKIPGAGFENEDKITTIFYLFDPMRFGAEAYRHYRREGNGKVFLRAVLSGEVLAE